MNTSANNKEEYKPITILPEAAADVLKQLKSKNGLEPLDPSYDIYFDKDSNYGILESGKITPEIMSIVNEKIDTYLSQTKTNKNTKNQIDYTKTARNNPTKLNKLSKYVTHKRKLNTYNKKLNRVGTKNGYKRVKRNPTTKTLKTTRPVSTIMYKYIKGRGGGNKSKTHKRQKPKYGKKKGGVSDLSDLVDINKITNEPVYAKVFSSESDIESIRFILMHELIWITEPLSKKVMIYNYEDTEAVNGNNKRLLLIIANVSKIINIDPKKADIHRSLHIPMYTNGDIINTKQTIHTNIISEDLYENIQIEGLMDIEIEGLVNKLSYDSFVYESPSLDYNELIASLDEPFIFDSVDNINYIARRDDILLDLEEENAFKRYSRYWDSIINGHLRELEKSGKTKGYFDDPENIKYILNGCHAGNEHTLCDMETPPNCCNINKYNVAMKAPYEAQYDQIWVEKLPDGTVDKTYDTINDKLLYVINTTYKSIQYLLETFKYKPYVSINNFINHNIYEYQNSYKLEKYRTNMIESYTATHNTQKRLYRGMNRELKFEKQADGKEVWLNNAFLSTSLKMQTAMGFITDPSGSAVLYEIELGDDVPYMYMYSGYLSFYEEYEVLFPPGVVLVKHPTSQPVQITKNIKGIDTIVTIQPLILTYVKESPTKVMTDNFKENPVRFVEIDMSKVTQNKPVRV